MRNATLALLVALAIGAPLVLRTMTATPAVQNVGSNHTVTKADVERWKKELSNWGRWGKDDQIGTLNLSPPRSGNRRPRW